MKEVTLSPQVDLSHRDLIVPEIDLGDNWRDHLPSGPEESTTPRQILEVVEATELEATELEANEHEATEQLVVPTVAADSSSHDRKLQLGPNWRAELPLGPEQSTTYVREGVSAEVSLGSSHTSVQGGYQGVPTIFQVASRSSGTWSAAGNGTLTLLQIFEATNPISLGVAIVSTGVHTFLGWLGLRNEYRETVEKLAKDLDVSGSKLKQFEFKPGVVGYLHAEASSPGVRWTAVAAISLVCAASAYGSGNVLDGAMYSLFALGQVGAASIENRSFYYWERYSAFKRGVRLEEVVLSSPLDPIVNRPGIPWCIGDVLAGVRTLGLAAMSASPVVAVCTAVGVGLGIFGLIRTIFPSNSKAEGTSSDVSFEIKMNSLQNGVFAAGNAAATSLMAIPLGLWAVSSYLIAHKVQSQSEQSLENTNLRS